jgi:multidrug transporter EmrE-like cation transporter
MTSSPLFLIVASVVCSSVGQLALKLAASDVELDRSLVQTLARLATNGWLVVGVILYLVALALWIPGLKKVDLSMAYPFIALGVVLVTLLSWLFLQEAIGAARLAGIGLIACGLFLIART